MPTIRAYAKTELKNPLAPFEYEVGALGDEEVEVAVDYCGLCHSDLSMANNEWGMTQYPFVPGHEVSGRVLAMGSKVPELKKGQNVGVGWYSKSCMHCMPCLSGDHNLCTTAEQTIVGRHGGFADKIRAHWSWVTPLPEGLDPKIAGPLFCGGITVFNPILMCGVKPLDRVGVVGIGGLGHMALQFLNKWGCEVTAFTSSASKAEEAKQMGAHHVVATGDKAAMKKIAGSLNFILSTVNVTLDWPALLETLGPKGKLHTVGAVLEPMAIPAFGLIGGAKSVSGSPLGSIATTRRMLEFCVRHDIKPVVEEFPMSQANEALARLESGKARYRIVLKNDWK
jgi:uncharacterized zinc-type alcohol dehydrogenase-like protein